MLVQKLISLPDLCHKFNYNYNTIETKLNSQYFLFTRLRVERIFKNTYVFIRTMYFKNIMDTYCII